MKGVSEPTTNTLLIVGGLFILIALVATIFPVFLDILKTAALDSADLVAKELSELVTVSAAATGDMQITYNPSNLKYDVDIKDRILQVDVQRTPDSHESSAAKIAVDVEDSIQKVSTFNVIKSGNEISIPVGGNNIKKISQISIQGS